MLLVKVLLKQLDPGASETNQANRIKLLMTVAKDNLETQINRKKAIDKENEVNNLNETKENQTV